MHSPSQYKHSGEQYEYGAKEKNHTHTHTHKPYAAVLCKSKLPSPYQMSRVMPTVKSAKNQDTWWSGLFRQSIILVV